MRRHVITIDGIARVGEHYPNRARHKETGEVRFVRDLAHAGIVPAGIKVMPEADAAGLWGDWEPIYPEPAEIVAKFHPDKRAKVTGARVIAPVDIPADREPFLRDAWEDDGETIAVNMVKARAAFETQLTAVKRSQAGDLLKREMAGEDIAAEKVALQAIDPRALATGKATPADLKAAWPFGAKTARA